MVYFILAKTMGLIKIGRTNGKDVSERLKALQCASPDKLECLKLISEDITWSESKLHSKFAHLWSHGEWFKGDKELLDFIESLPNKIPVELSQDKVQDIRGFANYGKRYARLKSKSLA